jgi:competence protein ComEA
VDTGDAAQRSGRVRLGIGAGIVLVVTALAVTVLIGVVRSASSPLEDVPIDDAVPASAGVEAYVHVDGAVARPGLYRLAAGARVVDAVAAAGGLTDDADRSGVNLAREVADGEQLRVPREGEDVASPGTDRDGRVNLNTADAAALETLPRIGPALAARIIAWREENGRFTTVEDLLAVSGIGDKMLAALRGSVTV